MTAPAWQPVWSTAMRDTGSVSIAAGAGVVIVGTGRGSYTDLFGSLTILDADTGNPIGQLADYWLVTAVAASTDGRTLAFAHYPNTASGEAQPGDQARIRVLTRTDDRPLNLSQDATFAYTHPGGAETLAISPDGRQLAAISTDGSSGTTLSTVFGFAVDGTNPWSIHLADVLGDTHWASGLAWSPDCRYVAYGNTHGVTVLDLRGAPKSPPGITLSCPQVVTVAFSPDGTLIAAGDGTGVVRVFDAATGDPIWPTSTSPSSVLGTTGIGAVAFSADQAWVAAISADGHVGMYDTTHGVLRHPALASGLPTTPSGVQFSPTLRHVLAVSAFGSAVIDTRTWAVARRLDAEACLIPADGTAITAAATSIQRFDLGVLHAEFSGLPAAPVSVSASPAATPLFAVADTTGVTVVHGDTGTRLSYKPVPGTIHGLAFADGGQSVVAGATTGAQLFSPVVDRQWTFPTSGGVLALAVLGSTGSTVAVTTAKTVTVLDTVDGTVRTTPQPMTHPQPVTKLAASTDGSWIATGCTDRITRIFNAATGAKVFTGTAGNGPVSALAFQLGTALLASANVDGTVGLIDAAGAALAATLVLPVPVDLLAFSSDGALLAVTDDDNDVVIYDVTNPAAPTTVNRITFPTPVTALSFNPADHTLAVANADTTVAVHDPRTSTRLELFVHSRPVSWIAHSADGTLLASACDDQAVRTWTC